LNDGDSGVRAAAANALGMIKHERAIEPLMARLNDSDSDVQAAAANALGAIGSDRATEALIARLNDDNSSVRAAAANALGDIRDDRATEALIARLNDDPESGVRAAAANALGAIRGDPATHALIARLNDDDSHVRGIVLQSLAGPLDEVDRKLLSRDLDALTPFLDPCQPIKLERSITAASILNLPADDVRARYKKLALRFGLHLNY
jgi:HEAT repeat protein